MKNTALEVKEDGHIWLHPEFPIHNTSYEYDKREALLVSNQEVAEQILFKTHSPSEFINSLHCKKGYTLKPGIYPIPGLKWEKEERQYEDSGTDEIGNKVDFEWVAVISKSESPLIGERSAEEILQMCFDKTGHRIGNTTEVQFCYSAIFDAMKEYAAQFKVKDGYYSHQLDRIHELTHKVNELERESKDHFKSWLRSIDVRTSVKNDIMDYMKTAIHWSSPVYRMIESKLDKLFSDSEPALLSKEDSLPEETDEPNQ